MNDSSWKREQQSVCVQSSTGPIITRCHSEGVCQPERCLQPRNSCSFPHPLFYFLSTLFCRFQLFSERRTRRVLHQLSGCWEVARRLDPTFLPSFSLSLGSVPSLPSSSCARRFLLPFAVREHTCWILALRVQLPRGPSQPLQSHPHSSGGFRVSSLISAALLRTGKSLLNPCVILSLILLSYYYILL